MSTQLEFTRLTSGNNVVYYEYDPQRRKTQVTVNGNTMAEYAYDAWGNYAVIKDTDGLAELNPFRYRSYYYDAETSLYYLQTRYYDPEVGRFIS